MALECLPFVRRVVDIRNGCAPPPVGLFTRKVFQLSKRWRRKERLAALRRAGIQVDSSIAYSESAFNDYSTTEEFGVDGITSYSEDSETSSDSGPYSPSLRCYRRSDGAFTHQSSRSEVRSGQRFHLRIGAAESIPEASSCTSFADNTTSLSMHVITVKLNLDEVNFLGMSIVGQCYSNGDKGIFVGAIIKGGAVDKDGRIAPGDMILAINDTNVENMTNKMAVNLLRTVIQESKTITLVVAKCWDEDEDDCERDDSRLADPVRPLDPSIWVAHTNAMCRKNSSRSRGSRRHNGSYATLSSVTSSSLASSVIESERGLTSRNSKERPLTVETPPRIIIEKMTRPDSGLEFGDQEWLKMKISSSFLGRDMIDWLLSNVHGFIDRRDAKKYATSLLRQGYIRSSLKDSKKAFFEEGYYTLDDVSQSMESVRLSSKSSFFETNLDQAQLNITQSTIPSLEHPFNSSPRTMSITRMPLDSSSASDKLSVRAHFGKSKSKKESTIPNGISNIPLSNQSVESHQKPQSSNNAVPGTKIIHVITDSNANAQSYHVNSMKLRSQTMNSERSSSSSGFSSQKTGSLSPDSGGSCGSPQPYKPIQSMMNRSHTKSSRLIHSMLPERQTAAVPQRLQQSAV